MMTTSNPKCNWIERAYGKRTGRGYWLRCHNDMDVNSELQGMCKYHTKTIQQGYRAALKRIERGIR